MKYIVILGDGMADRPLPQLQGKTPLQAAHIPHMDYLAAHGLSGMVQTVPGGMPPGSDTANLSVMGFDPAVYYTGRSPLEAVSMGIDLALTDVTYRANTVTLSEEEALADCTMVDYSCDEITTAESTILVNDFNRQICNDVLNLYAGISYRHCLVLKNGETGAVTTPPHDILTKKLTDYLPKGVNAARLLALTEESRRFFKNHPVNLARVERGLRPASALWFWGEGRKPKLASFEEKYGVRGAVVSAVDLIKGIGICAGLQSIDVPGATGNVDTNFEGKAEAAMDALRSGCAFVYVHVEAPDECGHRAELENKVKAIEYLDSRLVGPMMEALKREGMDYRMLLLPDHPTPIALRTHVGDPVPFALYQSNSEKTGIAKHYDEASAAETGIFIEKGYTLLDMLIKK